MSEEAACRGCWPAAALALSETAWAGLWECSNATLGKGGRLELLPWRTKQHSSHAHAWPLCMPAIGGLASQPRRFRPPAAYLSMMAA